MPLKSLKHAVKDRILRPAKRCVKQLLLRLLSRLDDSAQYNLAARAKVLAFPGVQQEVGKGDEFAEVQGPPSAKSSSMPPEREANEASGSPAPTLVLNDQGTLVNERMLALYFRAIFAGAPDSAELREIWTHLAERPERWTEHSTLVRSLVEFLERNRNSSDFATVWADLAHRVRRHEDETLRNRSAYRTDDKWNPRAVFWPDPTSAREPSSLYETQPIAAVSRRFDKQTPIGSAGSCFAMEIAHRLQAGGYNYVVTEPNPNEAGHSPSCAKWGIIFNTPSFRQLVERAFGVRRLPRLLWTQRVAGRVQFQDPFREDIVFDSLDDYDATYDAHEAAARQALLEAKVFVLTLGMNEIWRLKGEDAVFSRAPWRIAAGVIEHEVLSVEDNVRELQQMLDVWRKHNPSIELIISVSPVPLHATFRGQEQHVVAANAHSKATLRLAAEEFCRRNSGVHYFPSYESVMYCTANAWQPDERHVSRHAVDKVMKLFAEMFLAEEPCGTEIQGGLAKCA